ncbi:PilX N-terminal domain-containing pilus assembly protein [Thalassolituus sp.]|jgi:hypothetical protein|uniref:pilus assembly PilX family protein n=1 Tax=Thalassolituus sp. TaxID=2030822 RepID=UPI0026370653|nr:PilX N-terminal domain-containing pilus assembly protein [uncultured Thalassolituus sp.]TNC91724.1 MAG: hypothetical protein CSH36_08165 [Thalassolituus sp.]
MQARSFTGSRGAALIVSMILLTATTMTALVALQNSSMQIRMVGNTQSKESVFQAAMSELESNFTRVRQDTQLLADAAFSVEMEQGEVKINQDSNLPEFTPQGIDPGPNYKKTQVETSIVYVGRGLMFSRHALGTDTSVGKYSRLPFEINADAAIENNAAFNSSQTLNISFLASAAQ